MLTCWFISSDLLPFISCSISLFLSCVPQLIRARHHEWTPGLSARWVQTEQAGPAVPADRHEVQAEETDARNDATQWQPQVSQNLKKNIFVENRFPYIKLIIYTQLNIHFSYIFIFDCKKVYGSWISMDLEYDCNVSKW